MRYLVRMQYSHSVRGRSKTGKIIERYSLNLFYLFFVNIYSQQQKSKARQIYFVMCTLIVQLNRLRVIITYRRRLPYVIMASGETPAR